MLTDRSIDWQGKMLGHYRLLRLIGYGTMGELWQAEDSRLRRHVAIKLLPTTLAEDTHILKAFTNEVHAIATLEHPHLLPIYDCGKAQTAPGETTIYVVMRLINGASLSQRIHTGLLPIGACLHYLKQAAQAIDYAHGRLFIHRDIKPANMLLQEQQLFLTDFGLAKLFASVTSRNQIQVGTPEYMAPEQVQSKAIAASDRYSLAVIAYQLFTGTLPFQGATPDATMMMHVNNPPPPARHANITIPPLVEETLVRGLAKRPEERPATCLDFINALEQGWKTQKHSAFDPDTTLSAPWRKFTNEDVPQLPFPEPPYIPPTPQSHIQETPLPQTTQSPTTPLPNLRPGSPSLYHQNTLISQQNIATARSAFPQQDPAQDPSASQQNIATFRSAFPPQDPAQDPSAFPQQDPTYVIPQAEASAKKKQLVIGRRAVVLGSTAAALAVVGGGALLLPKLLSKPTSVPAAKAIPGPHKLIPGIPLLALTGHSSMVRSAVWSPNGKYLATASQDTRVMLWDVESSIKKNPNGFQSIATPMKMLKFVNPVLENHMSWSHDGHILGVSDLLTPKIHLFEIFSKDNTPQDYIDVSQLTSSYISTDYDYMAMSPVDNTFATGIYSSNKVALWQQNKPTAPIKTLSYNQKQKDVPPGIEHIGWSSDGAFIAGTPANFSVVVWQVKTGKIMQEISLPERTKKKVTMIERSDLKYSPIDPYMLAASDIDIVTVYDTKHNKLLHSLGTDDPQALTLPENNTVGWVPQVGGTTWSPNGRYIAGTYGRSNKIYIWDTQGKNPQKTKDGSQIQSLFFGANNGHTMTLIDIAWSPDGRYIATTSFDKTVIIWKVDGA